MIHSVPTLSISFDDSERQRGDLGDVQSLAESIRNIGLINPIVITKDHALIAGRRRLEAHRILGFDMIEVRYWEEVDNETLQIIELEENVKRKDLTWQEHVRAVARFHDFHKSHNPEWNYEKTARELNMGLSTVHDQVSVARELEAGTPEVEKAARFSEAFNFTKRKLERKAVASKRDLDSEIDAAIAPASPDLDGIISTPRPSTEAKRYVSLLNADFTEWAPAYTGEPFNLIHCDFPYGISAGDKMGQSGAKILGGYDDSPDVYWRLLDALNSSMGNVVAESAHLVFWYSMKYHDETMAALSHMGWKVNPFPLIWHKSDNAGVLPDPERGPRRTYETALFASRGDRKIVKAVANSFSAPTSRVHHMSEKPTAVLEHFFRMVVDEYTTLLDPTAGSANSIKTAEKMGAGFSMGLEISEEYFGRAKENLGI